MTNGKQVSTGSLGQIAMTASVGMEDVVNVFLSRHEDALHAQREEIQGLMKEVNKKVSDLTQSVEQTIMLNIKQQLMSTDNDICTISTSYRKDSLKINWSERNADYDMEVLIVAKTTPVSQYHHRQTETFDVVAEIDHNDVVKYQELMTEKALLTDRLTVVNNGLRDLARKERKVRGVIAEKKLTDMGLEDLLKDQQLLALIDESSK